MELQQVQVHGSPTVQQVQYNLSQKHYDSRLWVYVVINYLHGRIQFNKLG